MACLEQLKFECLRFPNHDLGDLEFVFTIPFVHLEDVSQSFIADISYFDPLSVLHITRCPLPSLHNFGSAVETLVLEASVNLLGAVAAWEGGNLWLDHCHSFPGMFLEALGHVTSLLSKAVGHWFRVHLVEFHQSSCFFFFTYLPR